MCCKSQFSNLIISIVFDGEVNKWLAELPNDAIKSWEDLVLVINKIFFPTSKIVKLRNDIKGFKRGEGEPIHETWMRFKSHLHRVPNSWVTK